MNERTRRTALAVLLSATLLWGCGGTTVRTTYYSLYVPAETPADTFLPHASSLVLAVGPVNIPDLLRQARIATGGEEGRYQLSEHHRWSGEVDRDFARALAEQLAARLGTERVGLFPWNGELEPMHRVLVDLLAMGGLPGQEATMTVRWSLLAPANARTLVVRRSDFGERLAVPGYPAWVAAQQRNIARLGEEIAAAIETARQP